MNGVWQAIGNWAESIELAEILLYVVVGIIIYKFCGPAISWFVHLIAKGIRGGKEPKVERNKRLKTLVDLFTTVAKIIVVLTVLFTILNDLHVNLIPLFASAGVAGVALGFGAQNIIKDALAGLFIILENQYRVGDFIYVMGIGIPEKTGGTVEKLSIRATTLRDRDGNVHFIPNGSLVQVVNATLGFSKVHFTFAVGTGTDTELIIKLINDMGREMAREKEWHEKIVDPPRFSEVGKIGKDGFNITVTGVTEPATQWEVASEFRRRLVIKLRKRGIETIETIE